VQNGIDKSVAVSHALFLCSINPKFSTICQNVFDLYSNQILSNSPFLFYNPFLMSIDMLSLAGHAQSTARCID